MDIIYNFIKESMKASKHQKMFNSFIKKASETYDSIYYIDFKSEQFVCLKEAHGDVEQLIGSQGEHSLAVDLYVDYKVRQEDKEKLREFFKTDIVVKRLKMENNISITYQEKSGKYMRGSIFPAEEDDEGNITGVLYVSGNVTKEIDREKQEDKDRYRMTYDELTGLLNQNGWNELTEKENYRSGTVGLMVVTFDQLEEIIKNNGQSVGDRILKKVVERIRVHILPQNISAYLGGNIIVIIMPHFETKKNFSITCTRIAEIHDELKKMALLNSDLSISVGMAFSKKGYSKELYYAAYEALDISKKQGNGGCTLIDLSGKIISEWHDRALHIQKDRALESSMTGTWCIEIPDGDGEAKMYVDEPMLKMIGIHMTMSNQQIYKFWYARIKDDYRDTVQKMMQECIDGRLAEVTYKWLHPTLGTRVVRCGGTRDYSFEGGTCIYGYHQDLRDTEIIRKKEDKDFIDDAIMGNYFRNIYINLTDGTFRIMRGMKKYGMRGNVSDCYEKEMKNFIKHAVAKEDKEAMKKFLALDTIEERLQKNMYIEQEYLSTREEGWCRCRMIPVRWNRKHQLTHVLLSTIVIDKKKKKELEIQRSLSQALREAEKANMAKTEFLSSMSHDIRTPMNAIVGLTDLAKRNIDSPDKVMDCLNKITSSSNHLLMLINEILDMRRIESGMMKISNEKINLTDILEGVMTLVNPQIKQHQHSFCIMAQKVLHEEVYGDSLRLRQILVNILSNAVKYTPDGGKIYFYIRELEMEKDGKIIYEFLVKDNGIGMSEEYLKKIFKPFSREEDTRTNKILGSGLGMAIVKQLIDEMKGTITVESKLNEGSCFTVKIPLQRCQKDNDDEKDLVGLRALIADDKALNCESGCMIMNDIGMQCDSALSGLEAIEKVKAAHKNNNDYSVILLDWQMPEMDGIETTRRIRKEVGEEVPIIIMTAYNWNEVEQEAMNSSVNGFLQKPLFRKKLVKVLKDLQGEQKRKEMNSLHKEDESEAHRGKRILVVEDQPLNMELSCEFLQMMRVVTEKAHNGAEAVKMVEESKEGYYDLVFMDVQMPIMNGYEATKNIRKLQREDVKKLPIIAMTANVFSSDVENAKRAGMNEHIGKPVDFRKLKDILDRWTV